MRTVLSCLLATAAALTLAACGSAPPRKAVPAASTAQGADIVMAPASGSLVSGRLHATPTPNGVRITGELGGLSLGSTHAIHHFVVKEPFYIRQWTAKEAHAVMREMGVRFNDTASIFRANRWNPRAATLPAGAQPA